LSTRRQKIFSNLLEFQPALLLRDRVLHAGGKTATHGFRLNRQTKIPKLLDSSIQLIRSCRATGGENEADAG
jgi:hypothetical protein